MKKLLFLLLILPALAFSETLDRRVSNAYSVSPELVTTSDSAWQIHNSSNNVNSIYVGPVDVATTKGGYFIFYSTTTDTGNGFSGSKTLVTANPVVTGLDIVSVSSCTTATAASAPTGNAIWSVVAVASSTVRAIESSDPWVVKPGNSIYVIKRTGGADDISIVSFYIREFQR